MGVDIHIKLFKYNEKENIFEKITLYRWDKKTGKYQEADVFPGRDSEMFNGMTVGDDIDGYGYFPSSPICLNSLFELDKKEIEEDMKTMGYYDFNEINLAEMALYCDRHKKVVDYNAEWNDEDPNFIKPTKDNPICSLFEQICQYLSFADDYWDFKPLSYYKVIFYFDH